MSFKEAIAEDSQREWENAVYEVSEFAKRKLRDSDYGDATDSSMLSALLKDAQKRVEDKSEKSTEDGEN